MRISAPNTNAEYKFESACTVRWFMKKRRLIGYFCLLIYLLTWLGSAQAMPLLLASLGYSHKIFLSHHGDSLQIALHHPGYIDEHEPISTTAVESHPHDLLDEMFSVLSDRDAHDYSDHVIHIPLDKQPLVAASKKVDNQEVKLPIAFSFQATAPPFPSWIESTHPSYLDQPPPDIPSIPLHLRTTVLLI